MGWLSKLFGKKEPVQEKPSRCCPISHLFLTDEQMKARKHKEPEKFICTRVAGISFILPEAEYHKQINRYKRFRALLLSMCRGQCSDCIMRSIRRYEPLEYSCRIQTLFDPIRNKQESQQAIDE